MPNKHFYPSVTILIYASLGYDLQLWCVQERKIILIWSGNLIFLTLTAERNNSQARCLNSLKLEFTASLAVKLSHSLAVGKPGHVPVPYTINHSCKSISIFVISSIFWKTEETEPDRKTRETKSQRCQYSVQTHQLSRAMSMSTPSNINQREGS